MARLAMVGPDGRSTLITAGWHRLAADDDDERCPLR